MEQFRQIGEALGSLKAVMVFREEIRINQRQCCLLFDAFILAFQAIADEMRHRLRLEGKLARWKPLEQPLKELHRIFREGEHYIRHCLETRDWWAKSLSMSLNTDCIDLHLHNLLWCIPVVIEAIENIAEADQDDVVKNRVIVSKKYERDWMEPKLFQQNFGTKYLVSSDMISRFDTAWKEDRWILSEMISEKRSTKRENRLADLLTAPKGKLFPCSVLVEDDYQVRRRLGSGSSYKEIQWMGASFAAKHVIGDIEAVKREISLMSSVSHSNLMHCLYAFCDEEKKECFMIMELMSKDLSSYVKEICSPRKRVPFSLPVAVDIMIQIARGMEYLHSRKIYHGELNPSNILVKPRISSSSSSSPDAYLHVKLTGYGVSLSSSRSSSNPCIWYAPEVLLEQESNISNYTEKADVYSFAMICFELLTGKPPFEDGHLQGERTSKNIRAGERPLFPIPSPKYLTGLMKRCWQTDPLQRPSFSSICRVLRYVRRFLMMNPNHSQPDHPVPPVDYFDLESSVWKKKETLRVWDIPFQMFAYRVVERERTSVNLKEKSSESGSQGASVCEDDSPSPSSSSQGSSDSSKKGSATKKIGQHQKTRTARPPQLTSGSRLLRVKSETQIQLGVSSPRGNGVHQADSEIA